MQSKIKMFVFCGLIFLCPFLLPNLLVAQPVIDQSFTSPSDLSAFINECCAFVAQTFTAGLTGTLDGVYIDVGSNNSPFPLHVAIHTVTISGEPSSTILGNTTLSSNNQFKRTMLNWTKMLCFGLFYFNAVKSVLKHTNKSVPIISSKALWSLVCNDNPFGPCLRYDSSMIYSLHANPQKSDLCSNISLE